MYHLAKAMFIYCTILSVPLTMVSFYNLEGNKKLKSLLKQAWVYSKLTSVDAYQVSI